MAMWFRRPIIRLSRQSQGLDADDVNVRQRLLAKVRAHDAPERLPRRVGNFKAREISFTGLSVSGREAERIGLANKCVPDDQLETVTMDMARAIAGQSRHSIFAYKELYIAQADLPLDAGLAHEVFNTKGRGTDLEERVAQGFSKK